jgi:hypothetical protein
MAGDPRRHRPLPDARHPESGPSDRAGRQYNVTGTRADAAERSRLRADGLDQGQIRQDAGQELWGITLPVLP